MATSTVGTDIWRKACADSWVSTADTARLVRATLARAFPGVKFYVRSNVYSGGSSINVYYDGTYDDDGDGYVRVDYDGDVVDPTVVARPDYTTHPRWARRRKPGMPSKRDVDDALAGFVGSRFDPMIDLGYSVRSWLLPDGTATLGRSAGTAGSHGTDPAYAFDRPTPGAVLVHFAASHVFVNDYLPYDLRKKAAA